MGTSCNIALPHGTALPDDIAERSVTAPDNLPNTLAVRAAGLGASGMAAHPRRLSRAQPPMKLVIAFGSCERCDFLGTPCSIAYTRLAFTENRTQLRTTAGRWIIEVGDAARRSSDYSSAAFTLATTTRLPMQAITDAWEAAARIQYGSE